MIQHQDLSKPIYEKMKEMIMNQELKPGEKILQEKIAEKLGVSRTPLLKALHILENEYLVESVPRRGMYVRKLDLKEMIDVYDCREALEGMAAKLLAEKSDQKIVNQLKSCFKRYQSDRAIDLDSYTESDEKFHKLLVKLTDNQPLDKIYFFGNIHSKVVGLGLVRPPEETLQEHFEIINAIEKKDADNAEFLARQHIRKSRQLLSDTYKNQI